MRVSEIFGPTVEGEGAFAGERCWFVRLSGCNLTCNWCDTPYTWDWNGKLGAVYDRAVEQHRLTCGDIADKLTGSGWTPDDLLAVSGGEPLLQTGGLRGLLVALYGTTERWQEPAGRVVVHTNGTRPPLSFDAADDPPLPDCNIAYDVSPKLPSAGDSNVWDPVKHEAATATFVRRFSSRGPRGALFRFVVADDEDEAAVRELVGHWNSYARGRGELPEIPPQMVCVSPQARTAEELPAALAVATDTAMRHGWSVSDRLHVRLWSDERGR